MAKEPHGQTSRSETTVLPTHPATRAALGQLHNWREALPWLVRRNDSWRIGLALFTIPRAFSSPLPRRAPERSVSPTAATCCADASSADVDRNLLRLAFAPHIELRRRPRLHRGDSARKLYRAADLGAIDFEHDIAGLQACLAAGLPSSAELTSAPPAFFMPKELARAWFTSWIVTPSWRE